MKPLSLLHTSDDAVKAEIEKLTNYLQQPNENAATDYIKRAVNLLILKRYDEAFSDLCKAISAGTLPIPDLIFDKSISVLSR